MQLAVLSEGEAGVFECVDVEGEYDYRFSANALLADAEGEDVCPDNHGEWFLSLQENASAFCAARLAQPWILSFHESYC